MSNQREYLQLHLLVLLGSFIPMIGILITLPPVEIIFLRTLIAAVLLFGFLRWQKVPLDHHWRANWRFLLAGSLTSVYWTLMMLSAKISNASVCLVGIATAPLWVSFINPFFTGRRINFNQTITGVNAVFGVYMIFSSDFDYDWGLWVAILAGGFGALVTVINSRISRRGNHYVITFYQMSGACLGTALFLPLYQFYLVPGGLNLTPTLQDMLLILFLALIFSIYAYSLLIRIMKRLSPFTVALTTNLSPIYGITGAILFFGKSEMMNIYFYSGATIIIASVMAQPLVEWFFREDEIPEETATAASVEG